MQLYLRPIPNLLMLEVLLQLPIRHEIEYISLLPDTKYSLYCVQMVSSFYVAVPDIFFQTPTFLLPPELDSYQSNPEKYPRYGVLAADIRVKLSHAGVAKCIMIPDSSADATANDVLSDSNPIASWVAHPEELYTLPIKPTSSLHMETDYKIFCAQGDLVQRATMSGNINVFRLSRVWKMGGFLQLKTLALLLLLLSRSFLVMGMRVAP